MSAGFTPGPWSVRGLDVHAPTTLVCEVSRGMNREVDEADAHLIAAAPDLYNAVLNLLPMNCGTSLNVPDTVTVPVGLTMGEIRLALAALAKARGEA